MNSNNPCLDTSYRVSSWKTIHEDRKKTLGDRAFSNASAKIWNSLPQSLKSQQNLISTPLRHCFKLTILEKRLIYNFFLVFHIVYIFAFYCKFKIVTGNIVISNSIFCVWCTEFQSSLMNIYFRFIGFQSSLRITFFNRHGLNRNSQCTKSMAQNLSHM